MKHARNCTICGTEYAYCPDCQEFSDKPRWMFLFHDENCKKIWDVLNDYKAKIKNANQAKFALQRLDLSKRDSFDPAIKALIDKICAEADPEKKDEKISKYNHKK